MSILIELLVLMVAMFVATKVLKGFQIKGGFGGHLVVAVIFGLLQIVLDGVLFWALAALTFGLGLLLSFLTRLVVTAILLHLTDALSDRIHVRNFQTSLGAALVMAITGAVCRLVLGL